MNTVFFSSAWMILLECHESPAINVTTPFHTRRKSQTFSWNCICSPLHDYVKVKLELAYQGKMAVEG